MRKLSSAQATVKSVTLDSFDPEAMTETLQQSRMDHTLLEGGRFRGRLMQARTQRSRLDFGQYNLPVLARGPLAEDRLTLGFLLHSAEPCTFNGRTAPEGAILLYSENHELHARLPAATGWVSLQLDRDFLASVGLELPPRVFDVLVPETDARARLRRVLAPMLDSLAASGGGTGGLHRGAAESIGRIEDALVSTVCESRASGRPVRSGGAGGRSGAPSGIVPDAVAYIDARLDEHLTISELCAATGCAMHTLERLFSRTYGISPRRFITYRRLTELRRLLIQHAADEITVTDATLSCGLTHFGRAAASYKSVFGENPSETLRRRAPGPRHGWTAPLSSFG